jgi:hypothetical protein
MEDNDDDLRREAKERVQARVGFYWYLVVCGVVWTALVIIWYSSDSGGYFWPIWPILGMGIGLVFSGVAAFAPDALRPSKSTYEREYQKLKNKRDGV